MRDPLTALRRWRQNYDASSHWQIPPAHRLVLSQTATQCTVAYLPLVWRAAALMVCAFLLILMPVPAAVRDMGVVPEVVFAVAVPVLVGWAVAEVIKRHPRGPLRYREVYCPDPLREAVSEVLDTLRDMPASAKRDVLIGHYLEPRLRLIRSAHSTPGGLSTEAMFAQVEGLWELDAFVEHIHRQEQTS